MRQSAISIIEVLIVIALIGVISFPLYLSYSKNQANQGLRSSSEQLLNTLQTAHIFARETKDKKNWGVKSISENSFALIKGSASNSQVEKSKTLEPNVVFPEMFEVWFDAGTGETSVERSILIKNSIEKITIINIFKTGIIEIKRL